MKSLVALAALLLAAGIAPGADLADAAEAGDTERLRALVAAGADVEARQADGMTALLWAAYHDDLPAAQILLEAGASARAQNRYGVTPLALACKNGNAGLAAALLKAGADVESKGNGCEPVLMTAARTGRAECVKVLLEAGATVEAKERKGQTALMWAAAEGQLEVVDLLLAHGADYGTNLPSGFTPLLFAVRQGHAEVTRSLLKAGADVNRAADPERPNGKMMRKGTAPLVLAVENGHFELALELVEAGADPTDQRSGFTPLHVVTWVRKAVKGDGDDGLAPPAGSGAVESLEFVRRLVGRGAEVNARLKKGSGGGGTLYTKGATPFFLAAQTADLPLLKLLVELGADPGIPNVEKTPPLLAAAGVGVTAPGEEAGSIPEAMEVVEYLLKLGADINAVDANGETVMHGAAYKSAPPLIELLDARGADIAVWNRKNRHGWTPLLIAQGHRHGNFRPIATTEAAVAKVMRRYGVEPAPAP